MQNLTLYVLTDGQDPVRSDPTDAVLRVDDLGASRGDGIFETILALHGTPHALGAHLDRFERSAGMLDLPLPDRAQIERAVRAAASDLAELPGPGAVKLVMTRGVEGADVPTVWVLGSVGDDPTADHRNGLAVITLDRGYRHDVAETSPWLLQGAKTLSYAVNKAALREAARRGADDVLFLSSDGYVLEGPTSSLIARIDGEYLTPPATLGILPGTTQADLFTILEAHGERTRVAELRTEDLARLDAAWLCSSVRGAAPLRSLDGTALAVDHEVTALRNKGLDARADDTAAPEDAATTATTGERA